MKYIKTFEKKTLKYNVGDYIRVVGYPDIAYNIGKVAKVNLYSRLNGHWDYMINFIDNDNNYHDGDLGIHIDEDDTRRKLTEDEILEFESKISSIKYNL